MVTFRLPKDILQKLNVPMNEFQEATSQLSSSNKDIGMLSWAIQKLSSHAAADLAQQSKQQLQQLQSRLVAASHLLSFPHSSPMHAMIWDVTNAMQQDAYRSMPESQLLQLPEYAAVEAQLR
jgi:ribosomal protein S15P/S13E